MAVPDFQTLHANVEDGQTVSKNADKKKTAPFLHSYLIIEEPRFLALIHAAVPECQVPSRTTFSRSVVPQLCIKEKEY